MAPFIIASYLSDAHRQVLLALSKVFRITYCLPFSEHNEEDHQLICQEFLQVVKECQPELLQKRKVHLLLYMVECMKEFGPPAGFNTERCESFNSVMRTHNIYANRAAPSRDIATRFALMEQLRFLCAGGTVNSASRTAGQGLIELFNSDHVQSFFNGITAKQLHPEKGIYQAGTLRKLRGACQLGSAEICVDGLPKTLQQLPRMLSLQLPSCLSTDDIVYVYDAVMSERQLVKTGEFVQIASDTSQAVEYAILVLCISNGNSSFCLVREMERMEVNGEPVTNDFDCPLLTLTSRVVTISPVSIQTSVSIIHECNTSCAFRECSTTRRVEREDIAVTKLTFEHDWTNSFYCFNIYCMNQ